jgi:hypothetical protein
VTDENAEDERAAPRDIEIFAGTWRGTIIDQDMDGQPIGDTACTFCLGGTNHTFYASKDICADCHSPHLVAEDVQGATEFQLHQLEEAYVDYVYELMEDLFEEGYTSRFGTATTLTGIAQVQDLALSEARGRQGARRAVQAAPPSILREPGKRVRTQVDAPALERTRTR